MATFKHTKTIANEIQHSDIFVSTGNEWQAQEYRGNGLFETGPRTLFLRHHLVEMVDSAQNMICLQSFLVQDTPVMEAMLRAEKRGVKIFLMDSAEARLGDPSEETDGFVEADYKKLVNDRLRGIVTHRQASFLHAKFLLVDPRGPQARGALFTGNFNQKPFRDNPELGVLLNLAQIGELYKLFVYHFWEHCTHEQGLSTNFEAVKPLGRFQPFRPQHVMALSPEASCCNLEDELAVAIESAQDHISLSVYSIESSHKLTRLLVRKLEAGLRVELFTRPRQANLEALRELSRKGATVYTHPLIHAKSLVVDGQRGFVFSSNLATHGNRHGFEVGVRLGSEQTKTLAQIHQDWTRQFPHQFQATASNQRARQFAQLDPQGKWTPKDVDKLQKTEATSHKASKVGEFIEILNAEWKPSKQHAAEVTWVKSIELEGKPEKMEEVKREDWGVVYTANKKGKTIHGILLNMSQFSATKEELEALAQYSDHVLRAQD